jgi:hypothetical protein
MVLASEALAGSLLATDALARGGGGHAGGGGAGHTGGFARVRVTDLGGTHVGGVRGSYIASIPGGAVGYAGRTGYGTGILRGRYSVLAASALAQTAIPNKSADAYVPPTALDSPQNPPIGAPSSWPISSPGLTIVRHNGSSRNGSCLFRFCSVKYAEPGRFSVPEWQSCSVALRRTIDDRRRYQGRSGGLLLDRRERPD